MAFTLVTGQHVVAGGTGGTATVSASLPNNPTPGNLVCVGFWWWNNTATPPSITSVQDSAATPNAYTVTPNSPSPTDGVNSGIAWCAYLLSAPATANKTVTVTFGAIQNGAGIWIMEFASSVGGVTFDTGKDAAGTGSTGTSINTPTITPTNANELLFAVAVPSGHVSAMAGAWVCPESLPTGNGDGAAYILSASAATAVNFTQVSGSWDSMAMAFYEVAAVTTVVVNRPRGDQRPAPFLPSGTGQR